jgi:hypothetical protein
MKFFPRLFVIIGLSALALAQVNSPSQPATTSSLAAPVDVRPLLSRIQQETQGLNADVGKLRVEKWKADSSAKQQASQNVASIQRNVTAALPELVNSVSSAPQSLAANFKVYRNLNALYDVVSSLAESTGAFGKREEYDSLAPHVSALDDLRRSYADSLQQMAANADTTIVAAQRAQAAAAAAAQPAPKKIIVDDSAPTPPAKKKKATTKKSTASSSSSGTSTPQ